MTIALPSASVDPAARKWPVHASRARLEERSRTAPSVGAPLGLYRERARTTSRLLENMSSTGVWCFKGATRLLMWMGDLSTRPCTSAVALRGKLHRVLPHRYMTEPIKMPHPILQNPLELSLPTVYGRHPNPRRRLHPHANANANTAGPCWGRAPFCLVLDLQANNVHTVSRDKPETETGGINRDKTRYRTVPGARFCAGGT